jgi:hypothetical protein
MRGYRANSTDGDFAAGWAAGMFTAGFLIAVARGIEFVADTGIASAVQAAMSYQVPLWRVLMTGLTLVLLVVTVSLTLQYYR